MNLFNGWDRDKLAVACSRYLLLDNIDTEICNTYYQLGEQEDYYLFPLSLIKRKYPSGLVQFKTKERIQDLSIPKSSLREKLIMNYFIPFLKYTGLVHFTSKMNLSRQLREWLDEYQPEVIYIQAFSLKELHFSIAVCEYLNKPMVFHMMDDWPSVISHKGLFKNYWSKRIDTALRDLLDRCDLLMSIGDYMSEAYWERYHKRFIPFHNPIKATFWQQYQKSSYELSAHPLILYTGRIGLGIDDSLRNLAEVLQEINQEHKLELKLKIQSAVPPNWIKKYSCIEYGSFVPYEQLPAVLSGADILFLPHDFDPEAIKFFKLSMPTKASEFMASGTPILVVGPEETAIVKYPKDHHWAAVVTEEDTKKLKTKVIELINNKDYRADVAGNAKELVFKRHDAAVVSKSFQEHICHLTNPMLIQK